MFLMSQNQMFLRTKCSHSFRSISVHFKCSHSFRSISVHFKCSHLFKSISVHFEKVFAFQRSHSDRFFIYLFIIIIILLRSISYQSNSVVCITLAVAWPYQGGWGGGNPACPKTMCFLIPPTCSLFVDTSTKRQLQRTLMKSTACAFHFVQKGFFNSFLCCAINELWW